MKKAAIVVVVLLAILGGTYLYYRESITLFFALRAMQPQHSFASETQSAPPDYGSVGSWASLPDRNDPADVIPGPGFENRQSTAIADVFFVHPTTYFRAEHWNQPPDDEVANYLIDRSVLRNQASIFSGCCRIYVPRYRQATLYSFIDRGDDGRQAIELAYQDILRAFDYFVQHYNQGRPFILAGHSQGSTHLKRLLKDRVLGSPLKERLIAVYAIGTNLPKATLAHDLPGLTVCESARQLGCLITWNSVGPKVARDDASHDNVCVNPLTWMTNDAKADRSLNEGGVSYPSDVKGDFAHLQPTRSDMNTERAEIDVGIADAQCRDGLLWITGIRSRYYTSRPFGRDNYHIYDYSLFHMNVRKNAIVRTQHYLELHPPPVPEPMQLPSAPQIPQRPPEMPGQD